MIHPKVSGAALGGSLGVLIVSILASIHGVHLTAAANSAIPVFLSVLVGWLTPGTSTSGQPSTPAVPAAPAPVAAVPSAMGDQLPPITAA